MWNRTLIAGIYETTSTTMETNEYYIRFHGKAAIPEPLVLGEGYKVTTEGEITSTSDHNNQNGTKDVSYKFTPIRAEIADKYGKTIKVKDTRGWAAKIRARSYKVWESDTTSTNSHEEAYDKLMREINFRLEELYEESKQ